MLSLPDIKGQGQILNIFTLMFHFSELLGLIYLRLTVVLINLFLDLRLSCTKCSSCSCQYSDIKGQPDIWHPEHINPE